MHCPASLFKNDLMRKPDKASLRNVFLTDKATVNPGIIVGQHVLDGGNLLYRVHWQKGMKFKEIAETYVRYVRKNYGDAYLVFDGYDDKISTKSNAHAIRSKSKGSSQNVIIREENEVPYTKERFLSNNHNKTQLISLLSDYLKSDGQIVHTCRGDADTKIVSTAIELSRKSNVIVVADDTDVAIMLLYHLQNDVFDIYLLQEQGKKCWSIKEAHSDVTCKDHLLFIHAW